MDGPNERQRSSAKKRDAASWFTARRAVRGGGAATSGGGGRGDGARARVGGVGDAAWRWQAAVSIKRIG